MTNREALETIYKALDDKHGVDIRILDVHKICSIADYFVIAHGNNTNQIEAMIDQVDFELSKKGYEPKNIEGDKKAGWILMDYIDVVVHIFGKDQRRFYDLERMWADAVEVHIESKNNHVS